MPEVIVVGGGPTGLWLAAELRLAGVSVDVLEARSQRSPHSKAMTLHARTLEVLAMRGLDAQFVNSGGRLLTYHFGMLEQRLPLASLDSPFPYVLAHSQVHTEEKLERWALDLGANILRGHTVTDLKQDEDDVAVTVQGPDGQERTARASFVVGCDGSRSIVRQAAGIEFLGYDPSSYAFLADVTLKDPPAPGYGIHSARRSLNVVPLAPGHFRLYGVDPKRQDNGELTMDELRQYAIELTGRDFGMAEASWLTRFSSATRVAERYCNGRILLAGDAAHVHFPAGGVGLNIGIQDAMNLGWKLAAHLQERAEAGLLDTYHTERQPVGEEVARHTLAQGALIQAFTPEGLEFRGLMNRLLAEHPSVTTALVNELTGLDIAYPEPGSHRLVGARVPAPPATLGLLASAHPLLLVFPNQALPQSQSAAAKLGILVAQVPPSLSARPDWANLAAVLVRPDGHVWRAVDRSPQADEHLLSCLADLPARFVA